MDPGRERGVAAEQVQLAPHLDEHVLRDLLGVFVPGHVAHRLLPDARCERGEKFGHRDGIAARRRRSISSSGFCAEMRLLAIAIVVLRSTP